MYKLIIIFAVSILFSSCDTISGNGNIVTEIRKVKTFDGIRTKGSIDVEIVSGAEQTVKVEADENILPYIITKVNDGLLEVYFKSGKSYRDVHAKVFISASLLNKLAVSGAGGITSKDTLKSKDAIEIKISGSGDINVLADAPGITATISGSGGITIAGRTKDLTAKITGSGDLKGRNLLTENTNVKVTGSGAAHVYASVNLIAKVTGSGDIYYSGNPPSPQISKSGSGSVKAE